MFNFVAKVAVTGAVAYGVGKVLKKTGIAEKAMAVGTQVVDNLLTKLAQDTTFLESWDKMLAAKRTLADEAANRRHESNGVYQP